MNILLIRSPELDCYDISSQKINCEKQCATAVLIPINILQLGSYIKSNVYDINVDYIDVLFKIVNKDITKSPVDFIKQEFKKIKKHIDIVGLSSNINAHANSYHMCTPIIKEIFPDALLVAGGHYPSSFTEKVASDKNIDYVIVGEGEIPFTKLISDYRNKCLPNNKIIDTKEYLDDLKSFPKLDYEGICVENYGGLWSGLGLKDAKTMALVTSRGCPNHCIYCSTHNVWNYKFRAFSAEQILDEIMYLKNKHGFTRFSFVEDNFAIDKKRVKKFCQLIIDKKLDFEWYPSSIQINSLDEEMIQLMGKSNCLKINMAVETGSPKIQKLIKKNVRLDHAIKMAKSIKENNMLLECLLIFGFPYETIDDMHKTINFAKKLKCDWYQMGIATPLYGTEMYKICKDNNWLSTDDQTKTNVFRVGTFSTPNFTKKQVEQLMWDANYQLNFLENHAYVSGDFDKALSYFKRIEEAYPSHFICKYMLFKIYKEQGKNEELNKIINDLKKIYNIDTNNVNKLIKKYNIDFKNQNENIIN